MNLYNSIMEALEEDNKIIIEPAEGGVRIIVRNKDGRIHSTEIISNLSINKSDDPAILLCEALERRHSEVEKEKSKGKQLGVAE